MDDRYTVTPVDQTIGVFIDDFEASHRLVS